MIINLRFHKLNLPKLVALLDVFCVNYEQTHKPFNKIITLATLTLNVLSKFLCTFYIHSWLRANSKAKKITKYKVLRLNLTLRKEVRRRDL